MHHGTLAPWGIAPLVLFLICWLAIAWLSYRVRTLAKARHPDTFLATERILRARHGRGTGTIPFQHLRNDPVIAAEMRKIDRIKILAIPAWLLVMAALALQHG